MAGGNLTVKVLEEGVHSGDASGVVPSRFRLLRQLLSRIEDEDTGRIIVEGLHAEIPPDRLEQAREAARVLDSAVFDKFPFLDGMVPMAEDHTELVLNRTWRRGSASLRWWCAWIPAAATTSSSGALPRCAAWPAATSP